MDSQWLSLSEYSGKYQVSISTLRRRIRSGRIPFSLKMGKYFLQDESPVKLKKLKQEKKTVHNENNIALSRTSLKKKKVLEKHIPLEVGRSGLNLDLSEFGDTRAEVLEKADRSNLNQQYLKNVNQRKVDDKEPGIEMESEKIKKGSLPVDKLNNASFISQKERVFLGELVDSQEKLYELLEKKEQKINEQQNKITDLNTLVALLEKENKNLKSIVYQEKEMEEWLEMSND